MRDKVRVGAVSYLNTRPLVYGLERGLLANRIELTQDIPSRLADRMARGELDIALLPVIELARTPDLEIVPGLSITSRGPAGSVFLLSRVETSDVRRVALDPESRTSNALTRVLFAEVWGAEPEFEVGGIDLADTLASFDAALRIGDKALFEPVPDGVVCHDLGEVWTAATGLPFVYAVWAARSGVVDRELYQAFHASKRRGMASVDTIAKDYTWQGRTYPELAREYLTKKMVYRFGSAESRGLRRFLAAAERLGIISEAPRIRLALTSGTACDEPVSRESALPGHGV